jgi:hypothetical protein
VVGLGVRTSMYPIVGIISSYFSSEPQEMSLSNNLEREMSTAYIFGVEITVILNMEADHCWPTDHELGNSGVEVLLQEKDENSTSYGKNHL